MKKGNENITSEEKKAPPDMMPDLETGLEQEEKPSSDPAAKEKIKERIRPMFEEPKNHLACRLMDTADILRETSSRMKEKNSLGGGEYARKAADRLADYSGYLQNNDVNTILQDVRQFSRERPWLVMSGAFVLGATLARFMKASGDGKSRDQKDVMKDVMEEG